VVHADTAGHVELFGQVGAEPGGNREPLPYRTSGRHGGQPVPGEGPPHAGVGVQGGDELDLGGPLRGFRTAHPHGHALVVGGPEHHPAGHPEKPADLAGGQSGAQVHVGEEVRLDGEPVFAVEPAPGSQGDAVGAEPVMDGPGRDLGQFRDLGTGQALTQVQVGQERVRDGRSGAAGRTAPAAAPGLDGDSGPVQHAGDPLPADARDLADAVGGQALALVQVGDPLRPCHPRHVGRAAGSRAGAVGRGCDGITGRVRAAARRAPLGHAVGLPLEAGTVGGISAD
jgi:hypothetical protein